MEARVVLNTSFNTGQIDPRIFSGFLEHLGRSIYEGVYDPESDLSNNDGIRTDVAEAMTGMDTALAKATVASMLGPCMAPSRLMSV